MIEKKRKEISLSLGPEEYEGGSTGGKGRDGQGGEEVGQEEGGTRVHCLPRLLVVARPQPAN